MMEDGRPRQDSAGRREAGPARLISALQRTAGIEAATGYRKMTAFDLHEMTPIQVVLNELDEFAINWNQMHDEGGDECRRSRQRRRFRMPCNIWIVENTGFTTRHQEAITRNLSETGLGIVAKCAAHNGSPVEICVEPPGRSPSYFGGIVVFCRYTNLGFYEIGIDLKEYGSEPIFSHDPNRATILAPWVKEALSKMTRGRAMRRSCSG